MDDFYLWNAGLLVVVYGFASWYGKSVPAWQALTLAVCWFMAECHRVLGG